MAFDTKLADRVREFLSEIPGISIEEKRMFSGMAFMVNGKMCINISGENLMCRFDPSRQEEVSSQRGYVPMIMKGKALNGYCYVRPEGFKSKKDFEYWMKCCLEFNSKAKSSKKAKTGK